MQKKKLCNIDRNKISIQEEQTVLEIFLINIANDVRISTLFVFIKLNSLKAKDLFHVSKNGLQITEEKYKNHLSSDNCKVCTTVARCCPNIVDIMVLENINMS
jgi:hypothetical protein